MSETAPRPWSIGFGVGNDANFRLIYDAKAQMIACAATPAVAEMIVALANAPHVTDPTPAIREADSGR